MMTKSTHASPCHLPPERQERFANQAIFTPALVILSKFFHHGRLTWHGAVVNLKTGNMRPITVLAGE